MATEAQKKAQAKYDARTAKYISLKLNIKTDADLIDLLGKQKNVQGFIKDLIRKELKNRGE